MFKEDILKQYLEFSDEVKEAIKNNIPIVALESTIISHGMPYPTNLETAKKVEDIIRKEGCVPATTAIINGKIKVGLNKEELEFMATSKDIIKCSTRDYAYVVANKLNGATTVATTIITCSLANIKVFVTGGIGGVHRDANNSFDISRDLQELANRDVAVVCAGAKSILDIGFTLEYLETFGVPVLGINTKEMPAFFTRESGYELDYKSSEEEVAKTMKTKWDLGLNGGIVVANPIPVEYQMNKDVIDKAINQALKEAKIKNINGKDITPFLLSRVLEVTDGNSLKANIKLVENNAKVGAHIAKLFIKLNNTY
ncbi:MAG: pseudouridine-5'-phosphate glycosidase [Bacillales bacterium]